MVYQKGAACRLACLPAELLYIVLDSIQDVESLKSLSTVNRRFRELCAPRIFRTLNVALSTLGLDILVEISHSAIAPCIREILYEIPQSIDPLVEDWDYFRSHIYTPSEYNSDLEDHFWTFGGSVVSYSAVFSYFRSLSREQRICQWKGRDRENLIASFPRFPNLGSVHVSFVDGIKSPFRWFTGRVLQDDPDGPGCAKDHLTKLATAMIAAKAKGVKIHTFEMSGLYTRIDSGDSSILKRLVGKAFHDIQDLRIINSPTMLEFLTQVHMSGLRRFELGNCWLSIESLQKFVQCQKGSLRILHLEDVWMINERIDRDGVYLSMASAKTILRKLAGIWNLGILSEVTINRQPGGQCEVRKIF
ncbi:hypothetical protein BDV59DRAFT_207879 [Aspergillus ambiguus]|uniref:uncharacterized protein n=1 Tax=Aspergillus ambiguus TaxID=176160 RepID=UPI003CCDDB5E